MFSGARADYAMSVRDFVILVLSRYPATVAMLRRNSYRLFDYVQCEVNLQQVSKGASFKYIVVHQYVLLAILPAQ